MKTATQRGARGPADEGARDENRRRRSHQPRRGRAPRPQIEATLRFRARVRVHPRGFGFADLLDGLDDVSAAKLTSLRDTDPAPSAFCPPPVIAGLVDGDLVDLAVGVERDGRLAAVTATAVERARRYVPGTVTRRRGELVLDPVPSFANRPIPLPATFPKAARGTVVTFDADPAAGPVGVAVTGLDTTSPAWSKAVTLCEHLDAPTDVVAPDGFSLGDWLGDVLAGRTPRDLSAKGHVPGARLAREDLTGLVTVTIDGESTRDRDDALSAARVGDRIRVHVHIADVASAVGAGSALDARARNLATSLYLPDGSEPMLPRHLSEQRCSLNPGEDRAAISAVFDVTATGDVVGLTPVISTIRSDAALTYEAVQAHLAGTDGLHGETAELVDVLADAAARLGRHRQGRNVLPELFTDPDLHPVLHGGHVELERAADIGDAMLLVERLMVAANETIMAFLDSRGAAAIYRPHAGIDPAAVEMLQELTDRGGVAVRLDAHPDAAQIAEVLDALDDEDRRGFATAVGGGMIRATYDTAAGHHFGLDARPYGHFTSPIRRYADLVNHRAVRAALAGESPVYRPEELTGLAQWLDTRCGAVTRTERRRASTLWAAVLASRAGDELVPATAKITGFGPKNVRVRVDRLGVAGAIDAGDLSGYECADDTLSARTRDGVLRLGAEIAVTVSDADPVSGRIQFVPAP